MRNSLGYFRGLLGDEPSKARWELIWKWFTEQEDEGERQVMEAYAREHLASWPGELLMLPTRSSRFDAPVITEESWQLDLFRSLSFGHRDILFSHIQQRRFPLWGLQLFGIELQSGDFDALAAMPALVSLQHVHFDGCNWYEHMDELRQCGLLSRISSIGFAGMDSVMDAEAVEALETLICQHKALVHVTRLELSCGLLAHDSIRQVFGEKDTLPGVETLIMAEILNCDSLETFWAGIERGTLPRLKTLCIPGNQIMANSEESSPMSSFRPPGTIEAFDMSRTAFSDMGWDYLMDVFSEVTDLQVTSLSLGSLTIQESLYDPETDEYEEGAGEVLDADAPRGLIQLFQSDWMKHLQVLHIPDNKLTSACIDALVEHPALSVQLLELDLSDNPLDLDTYSEVLDKCKALQRLIIKQGRSGEVDPDMLEGWLRQAPFSDSFVELHYDWYDLSDNQPEGLVAIAEERGIRLLLGSLAVDHESK